MAADELLDSVHELVDSVKAFPEWPPGPWDTCFNVLLSGTYDTTIVAYTKDLACVYPSRGHVFLHLGPLTNSMHMHGCLLSSTAAAVSVSYTHLTLPTILLV